MPKNIEWFEKALMEGIESIESIDFNDENKKIMVNFKTDKAPISDLLEVMGRLLPLGI